MQSTISPKKGNLTVSNKATYAYTPETIILLLGIYPIDLSLRIQKYICTKLWTVKSFIMQNIVNYQNTKAQATG